MDFTKVTLAEVDQLQKIATQTFTESYGPYNTQRDMRMYLDKAMSKIELKQELQDKQQQFYFVTEQGKLVGYLKLKTGDAQDRFHDDPTAIELERLYLVSSAQQAGLGSEMLAYVIDLAKQQHKEYMWLAVWEGNTGAQKFYQQHHFKQIDRSDFVLGTQHEPGFIMKLDL